jgi:hypothetical protein
MWDLWWTKWHWDKFFSEFIGFRLSISLHHGSPYSHIIWGMNNRPSGGHSSEIWSHPIDMKNNKNNNPVTCLRGWEKEEQYLEQLTQKY